MDDIVIQAMAKWPHVPDCYGWLGLDARGNWYMRDERSQAAGLFDSGKSGAKGSRLEHAKLIDFMGRNYSADALGQWFFQNGPQRVYVELQAAPLIWRIQGDLSVKDHVGRNACVMHCLLDELGHLYLQTNTGFGLVHSQDMTLAAEAVEQGLWVPQDTLQGHLPDQFGFIKSPQTQQKI